MPYKSVRPKYVIVVRHGRKYTRLGRWAIAIKSHLLDALGCVSEPEIHVAEALWKTCVCVAITRTGVPYSRLQGQA